MGLENNFLVFLRVAFYTGSTVLLLVHTEYFIDCLISSQSCHTVSLSIWMHHVDENSVDPDQLASDEAS